MSDLIFAWFELEHRILKAKRSVEVDFAILNLGHALLDLPGKSGERAC